jgi:ADP-heptose:LPS heptosyltransferase
MRKILVLRGGALGDFIVTLPALALLRQRWPEAHLELVGNATAAQLALHRGLLNAVHSQHESRWSALFADAPLPEPLTKYLAGFDLVVNYWPDPDGDLRRRFPLHPNQVFLHAEAMPTQAPAAAHYCAPLRELGLETETFWYRLDENMGGALRPDTTRLTAESGHKAPPTVQAPIALHPGSGSPRKNWPVENWVSLLDGLPPRVSIILGEADRAAAQAFAASIPQTGRSKTAPLQLINRPLEDLVAHFAHCRLFLGHDSGISHLAAACGVPCVLLFGPTEPSVWAPPAPSVRVLRRSSDVSSISVEDVLHAAQAALSDQT